MGNTPTENTPAEPSATADGKGGRLVKYERVIQYVLETPWAIRPAVLGAIIDILAFRADGGQFTDAQLADRIEAARRTPRQDVQSGAVAVISLTGSIFPRANLFTEMSGGTSLQMFGAVLNEVANNPKIDSIVLDIYSPGGMVDLVPETGELIAAIDKPVTAVANTEAASAAYWLAAQADELVVTPSGMVGSIGVWSAHEDWSVHEANFGVDTTLVSAGKYKVEGHPFAPLDDTARAAMQEVLNTYYDMFVDAVAKGRGVSPTAVRNGFGEGRMLTAEKAVREGMADRVATLDQVISEHAGGTSPAGGRRVSTPTEPPSDPSDNPDNGDEDKFLSALIEQL